MRKNTVKKTKRYINNSDQLELFDRDPEPNYKPKLQVVTAKTSTKPKSIWTWNAFLAICLMGFMWFGAVVHAASHDLPSTDVMESYKDASKLETINFKNSAIAVGSFIRATAKICFNKKTMVLLGGSYTLSEVFVIDVGKITEPIAQLLISLSGAYF